MTHDEMMEKLFSRLFTKLDRRAIELEAECLLSRVEQSEDLNRYSRVKKVRHRAVLKQCYKRAKREQGGN